MVQYIEIGDCEVGIGVCNLIGFVAVCAALFFGHLAAHGTCSILRFRVWGLFLTWDLDVYPRSAGNGCACKPEASAVQPAETHGLQSQYAVQHNTAFSSK